MVRSLLRMTLKAPILYDLVFDFVKDDPLAVEVLSKKFQIEDLTPLAAYPELYRFLIHAN